MDLDFKKWLTTIPKKAREEHLSNYEKKVKIELNTHKIQRKTVQIKKTKWILEQISFRRCYGLVKIIIYEKTIYLL